MKWLLALFITIFSSQAFAHVLVCLAYPEIAQVLTTQYKEQVTHRGFIETKDGTTYIVEIWETEEKSTFSIVRMTSDGVACIDMFGQQLYLVKDTRNDET